MPFRLHYDKFCASLILIFALSFLWRGTVFIKVFLNILFIIFYMYGIKGMHHYPQYGNILEVWLAAAYPTLLFQIFNYRRVSVRLN